MLSDLAVKSALLLYNMGWKLAIPILQKNCRLAEGFKQRTLQYKIPPAADSGFNPLLPENPILQRPSLKI